MNTDYIIQYEHKKSGKAHFRVVPSVSSLQSAEQCFRDDFDYLDKFNLISVTPSGGSCYSEVHYPYEIHLTIRDYPESAEAFRKACEAAGVKPLLIALQDASLNLVQHDIMTKCDVKGTLQEVVDTAIAQKSFFVGQGYEVVRVKIESVPWHPASPKFSGTNCHALQYFECHAQFKIVSTLAEKRLLELCKRFPILHLSKNPFKVLGDGSYIQMLTIRGNTDMFLFRKVCDQAFAMLSSHGFDTTKIEHEFCVFDSNANHDKKWTES